LFRGSGSSHGWDQGGDAASAPAEQLGNEFLPLLSWSEWWSKMGFIDPETIFRVRILPQPLRNNSTSVRLVFYNISSSSRADDHCSNLCSRFPVGSSDLLFRLSNSFRSVSDRSSCTLSEFFCFSSWLIFSRSLPLKEICSNNDSCDSRNCSRYSSVLSWKYKRIETLAIDLLSQKP
jgi:hypothetical protein